MFQTAKLTLLSLCLSTTLALSAGLSISLAADQVGTVTQLEGDVKLFSEPSKTLQKDDGDPRPRALFQGEYYRVQEVKVGDRINQGNILRTALNGKARVVFDNGDQFHVGPGTSYRIFWDADSAKTNTRLNLVYGKLRGVIAKGGPRSRLQVKTKAATMGVRGTEFFIAENGLDGETEISIIRGSVQVQSSANQTKPIELKSGFSANIATGQVTAPKEVQESAQMAPKPEKMVPVIELRKTTQEDLAGIQKSSEIKAPEAGAPALSQEMKTQLASLEKKAIKTTLTDIKTYDPKLYAKLDTANIKTADQIHVQTVKTLIQTAPKAAEKRKPFKSELDNLEQGAYEKYFKIVE
ncbi:MAG: hypothetical protein A2Z97_07470 [Bdellovibrionales bacterium GWB1_52_6]|nr:MAG: hypothetical protein A2Z97_07470 [Bdellovibrionales bacterium GWB1_52_6]